MKFKAEPSLNTGIFVAPQRDKLQRVFSPHTKIHKAIHQRRPRELDFEDWRRFLLTLAGKMANFLSA